MKTTAIYHSGDYDGIFCREIARKFLPDAELIGWDFTDSPLPVPPEGTIYVLDLPVDRTFGLLPWKDAMPNFLDRLVWIDHHKSSIATHPVSIPGYRIDGVAACRLAWQWFTHAEDSKKLDVDPLPDKRMFVDREVSEPLAVLLAGEYDVWDHRGDGDLVFQFGLDCQREIDWRAVLTISGDFYAQNLISQGRAAMNCYAKRDADVMRARSFLVEWEGLKFLALNTARCNSNTFAARDVPETGHDALMGFFFNGKVWTVSMYHAKHRKDIDLSKIAVKHKGGGHAGACGFTSNKFPFI